MPISIVLSNSIVYTVNEHPHGLGKAIFLSALLSNIALNLFATCNIVIRLLHHRRQVLTAFGPGGSNGLAHNQLWITNVLLGSAALNVPVTILGAVLFLREVLLFTGLVLQLIAPLQVWEFLFVIINGILSRDRCFRQSIASVLVIYEVAKGRDRGK